MCWKLDKDITRNGVLNNNEIDHAFLCEKMKS